MYFGSCDLIKRLIDEGSSFAASWGHTTLSDFHLFISLTSRYGDDPSIREVRAGLSMPQLEDLLRQQIQIYTPISAPSDISPLGLLILHAAVSDQLFLCHKALEPVDIAVQFLIQPAGYIHNLYSGLSHDIESLLRRVVAKGTRGDHNRLVGYYLARYDLHKRWLPR